MKKVYCEPDLEVISFKLTDVAMVDSSGTDVPMETEEDPFA